MQFKGKVAAWFYGILVLVAAVEVPILIISVWIEPNLLGAAISLLVLIGVEALCLSIVLRNEVTFQKDALLVVFGFFQKCIPYEEIVCVSATKEPWASLAASADRIKIRTKSRGEILISVVEKKQFFREMQSRKPDAVRDLP